MYTIQTASNCRIRACLPSLISSRSASFTKDKQYSKRKRLILHQLGNGNLANGTVYLRRLNAGPLEQPGSLVIQTARENYLFNCGESSGRALHCAGVSSSRIAHTFITQRNWSCLGGTVDLIVNSVKSTGALPTFHGPKNLLDVIERMAHLTAAGVFSKKNFSSDIINSSDFHEDENFRFDKFPIKNVYHPDREVYSYLCVMKPMAGQMSVERITELEIPAQMIAHLYSGENVILDDGRLIKPADVMAARKEQRFLIVDIPSKAYLNDFVSNERLRISLDENKASNLDFIVHLTPPNIAELDEYQAFIEQFKAKRQFSASGTFSTMRQVHALQSILHDVDEDVHAYLGMKPSSNTDTVDLTAEPDDPSIKNTHDWRKITLHKNDRTFSDDVRRTKSYNWIHRSTDYEINTNKLSQAKYPHIVFLGTSSASATFTRNPSSILVNITENDSILLDCGGGTTSQLNLFYGDESVEIYKRLKGIFISHMHADHYMGLVGLLRMRKKYQIEHNPLRLLGPAEKLGAWLSFASENIELIRDNIKLIENSFLIKKGLRAADCNYLGVESFRTCYVPHCDQSFAASLTFSYEDTEQQRKSFKLTYSGDTIPCKQLVDLGHASTLLIHEATYPDGMQHLAKKSKHSTVSQAIQQAQQMCAEYTILTHFIGRTEEPFAVHAQLPDRVGVAFDFMSVCPDDLPRLGSFLPKYKEAFRKQTEPVEEYKSEQIL